MKLVRTPGAAPGTSGWKPDTLLLRHVRAEGRQHDIPCIGLDERTLTSTRLFRRSRLHTVELRRDGASAMTRTSIARLEDGSLSRWRTEACWTRRRESNSLVRCCRP